MKITVLSGGVGGARFTRGLLSLVGERAEVTVIANTGDDMWLHGVRVCPDLDTLMYTLGGAVHEEQGWGRRDESRRTSDDLAAYGLGWEWFTLGDLDLATHLARTALLRDGLPLSQVTARLAERWAPGVTLLPMTDDEVETHVITADGRDLHFEEWWVRHRAALPAARFVQTNLATATPAPGVLAAIADADVVVVPPSNPVVSVGTILAIPGVRDALRTTAAPVVGDQPGDRRCPRARHGRRVPDGDRRRDERGRRGAALRPAARRGAGRVARRRPGRRRGRRAAVRGLAGGLREHPHDRRPDDRPHRRRRARPGRPAPLAERPLDAGRRHDAVHEVQLAGHGLSDRERVQVALAHRAVDAVEERRDREPVGEDLRHRRVRRSW